MNQKGIAPIAIVLIILGILVLGGGSYYAVKKFQKPVVQICTQEAKQCLDGSYVSRTGPNCEFAACPTETPTAAPSITVLSPNGGETLKIGETYSIKWSAVGSNSNDIYISLVENMGGVTAPCNFSIVKLANGGSNTGSYSWKILPEYSSDMCGSTKIAGKQFKIMVSFRDASGRIVLSDESDNYFNITQD